jgi:hypothetical protein
MTGYEFFMAAVEGVSLLLSLASLVVTLADWLSKRKNKG